MRSPDFDFIGRRRLWFVASGVVVAIAVIALGVRGLNLSIEFRGGSSFTLNGITEEVTAQELEDAATDAGAIDVTAQTVREGGRTTGAIVRTEELAPGSPQEGAVIDALEELAAPEDTEVAFVGPTFGERISEKMAQALVVFLAVVVLYISVRLQFKMAVAALLALVHDLLVTSGVYAVFGFNVSPATVIALLTILGYSLYDTVIVFDRVKESEAQLGAAGRLTYAEAVNTAQNEVFWRSVNTTITSILPVGALLFVGSRLLGATTLEDVALALFVGMLSGAYSSLFIAGPFLALWREREPEMAKLRERADRKVAAAERADREEVTVAADRESGGQRADGSDRGGGAEAERPRLAPRDYVRGRRRRPRSRR